jgi:hypothetical protein
MTATRTSDSSWVSRATTRAGAPEISGRVGAGVASPAGEATVVGSGDAVSGAVVAGVPVPPQAATVRTVAKARMAIDPGRRMDGDMVFRIPSGSMVVEVGQAA